MRTVHDETFSETENLCSPNIESAISEIEGDGGRVKRKKFDGEEENETNARVFVLNSRKLRSSLIDRVDGNRQALSQQHGYAIHLYLDNEEKGLNGGN